MDVLWCLHFDAKEEIVQTNNEPRKISSISQITFNPKKLIVFVFGRVMIASDVDPFVVTNEFQI